MKNKGFDKKMNYFKKIYDKADGFQDIFELIKEGVEHTIKKRRAGLMLGLTHLGIRPNGFIGAFYQVGGNIIIMNKTPLKIIEATKHNKLKPYVFHVLMHEYLHSLGVLNEKNTELLTYKINQKLFGENHPVTKMSFDFNKLLPQIIFPNVGWKPRQKMQIEIVDNFEKINYIG